MRHALALGAVFLGPLIQGCARDADSAVADADLGVADSEGLIDSGPGDPGTDDPSTGDSGATDLGADDPAATATAVTEDDGTLLETDEPISDSGDDIADPLLCSVSGAPGECVSLAECAAIPDHRSVPGHCPGPADIQCCIVTPSTADNPPPPAGYHLMTQAQVTPEMTAWAVEILHDPVGYPMFASTTRTFGTQMVLARVEWHPPDFQNSVVHRGVTLYIPL